MTKDYRVGNDNSEGSLIHLFHVMERMNQHFVQATENHTRQVNQPPIHDTPEIAGA